MILEILEFLSFSSFFSSVLLFIYKVENKLVILSWNGLHKFPIGIFGKTQKPLCIKKWSSEIITEAEYKAVLRQWLLLRNKVYKSRNNKLIDDYQDLLRKNDENIWEMFFILCSFGYSWTNTMMTLTLKNPFSSGEIQLLA